MTSNQLQSYQRDSLCAPPSQPDPFGALIDRNAPLSSCQACGFKNGHHLHSLLSSAATYFFHVRQTLASSMPLQFLSSHKSLAGMSFDFFEWINISIPGCSMAMTYLAEREHFCSIYHQFLIGKL